MDAFCCSALGAHQASGVFSFEEIQISQRYPFIGHEGSEKEFLTLVRGNSIINLDLVLD